MNDKELDYFWNGLFIGLIVGVIICAIILQIIQVLNN